MLVGKNRFSNAWARQDLSQGDPLSAGELLEYVIQPLGCRLKPVALKHESMREQRLDSGSSIEITRIILRACFATYKSNSLLRLILLVRGSVHAAKDMTDRFSVCQVDQ